MANEAEHFAAIQEHAVHLYEVSLRTYYYDLSQMMKCGDHLYACGIFSSLFISHLSLYVPKKMKCGEELGELLQS